MNTISISETVTDNTRIDQCCETARRLQQAAKMLDRMKWQNELDDQDRAGIRRAIEIVEDAMRELREVL